MALSVPLFAQTEGESTQTDSLVQTLDKVEFAIPAGTMIPIKVTQVMSSSALQSGDRFAGNVSIDVIVGDEILFAEGQKVQGKVLVTKSSGRVHGTNEISLVLDKVKQDNKYTTIVTEPMILQSSEGSSKKVLRRAAAGAALGAVIDGGEGAWKGAAVGGTLSLIGPKGELNIPAGTQLQFKVASQTQQ